MLVAGTVLWSLCNSHSNRKTVGWVWGVIHMLDATQFNGSGTAILSNVVWPHPQNFLTKQGVACKWQAWKHHFYGEKRKKSRSLIRSQGVVQKIKNQLTSFTELENWLVVSTHLKNVRKFGSFPQIGMKIKNISKPPPRKNGHCS